MQFTSEYEKRIWRLIFVIIITMYATASLVGELTIWLVERRMLEHTMFWSFVVIVIAVIIIGLLNTKRKFIWMVIGVLAVLVMASIRVGFTPAERTHLFEYGLIAVLIYEALFERKKQGIKITNPILVSILITTLLGVIDEVTQLLIPNRVFDWLDIGMNTLAALAAMLAVFLLKWLKLVSGFNVR